MSAVAEGRTAPQAVDAAPEPDAAPASDAAAATPSRPKGQQSRNYVVLEQVDGDEEDVTSYKLIGSYKVSGDKQAIKAALDAKAIEIGGTFVAVTESAWHESTPKLKEVAPRVEF